MGIHIQTLRDRLCNHVFGLSSREKAELVSMKMGFIPSEGLCDQGHQNNPSLDHLRNRRNF